MRPGTPFAILALVTAWLLASSSAGASPPAAGAASPWRWPVEGRVITPYSNGPDPYAGGQHRGIDIAAPVGAPVVAAAAGVVRFAGGAGASGLTAAVRTDDGFDTSYLHLASLAVRAGDRLGPGARIGSVGTTGRRSAVEPHLHFGVRDAGSRFGYRDPLDFLPAPLAPPAPAAPVPVAAAARVRSGLGPVLSLGSTVPALVAPAPAAHAAPSLSPRPAVAGFGLLRARPGDALAAPRLASVAAAPAAAQPELAAADRGHAAAQRPGHVPAVDRPRAEARRGDRQTAAKPQRDGSSSRANPRRPAPRPAAGPSHGRLAPAAARRVVHPRHAPLRSPAPGIDVGWLVACIAMVTAAAILGRPRATGRSLRRAFGLDVARRPDLERS